MDNKKGFFGSLFDLSFSEFITTKIIKILYVIAILLSGLMALIIGVGGFFGGFLQGVLGLFLAPIVFILYIIITRIWLELTMVVFKIAENTAHLAGDTSMGSAPAPAAAPEKKGEEEKKDEEEKTDEG